MKIWFKMVVSLAFFPSFSWAVPVVTLSGAPSGFQDSIDRVIGWEFTTNTDLLVTRLGAFDFNQDGLATSHQIGIWTPAQVLITSGIVSAGVASPIDGFFRYVAIPSVVLPAGQTFIIAATWPGSDPFVWDVDVGAGGVVSGFSVAPTVTPGIPGSPRFNAFSSAFAFPSSTLGGPRAFLWGPNFDATATGVPEIDSEKSHLPLAFMALSLLAISGSGSPGRRSGSPSN